MKSGAELIAEERARQISVEGWTPEHDDSHDDFQLTSAAVCYAEAAPDSEREAELQMPSMGWPWHDDWWKPSPDPDALLQNLVVGFLGYWTNDGLSSDEWANPKAVAKR